ncbi:type I-E CRISPR-associated endoribonuclease Cas2e [Olsenella massiliensis]|uniref:type I-E CRISPR-associated endoribonuclease Cas2e n=1 Tax=Olsenella massiliensis TaxID=1622075 RepID=UPI00071E163D|nr:type I-E CRISPR-associated endoribonuclease Cas2e [Olsenella massiliensis]
MVVIVLTACPAGLRGDLTRWLLEISPGVYVGHLSARVREELWSRVTSLVREGRAMMVHSARNEQHLAFRVLRPDWEPVDCEGVTLVSRRPDDAYHGFQGKMKPGWSHASQYRNAHRFRAQGKKNYFLPDESADEKVN